MLCVLDSRRVRVQLGLQRSSVMVMSGQPCTVLRSTAILAAPSSDPAGGKMDEPEDESGFMVLREEVANDSVTTDEEQYTNLFP